MIPSSNLGTELTVSSESETSKTYKLSEDKIQGMIENLSALEQAIYKELNTEKYDYPIYSFDYGIELENLIGKEEAYVKAELKRRIEECLCKDDRIQTVDNFSFTLSEDEMLCTFDVESIYGDLTISKEVSY